MATCRCCAVAVGLWLLLGGIAQAEPLTLDAADRGYYRQNDYDSGYHNSGQQSYLAGRLDMGDYANEYRNFFVFDLTGLAGNITSAILRVNVLDIVGGDETYELYHVETDILTLTTSGSNKSEVYTDLGDGTVYGNRLVLASEANTFIDIALTPECVSDANATSDPLYQFAIGGAITSLLPGSLTDEYVFGSGFEVPLAYTQLIVEVVPEPGTLVLALTGAAFVFAGIRRRRLIG